MRNKRIPESLKQTYRVRLEGNWNEQGNCLKTGFDFVHALTLKYDEDSLSVLCYKICETFVQSNPRLAE